jgi:hypothetical protein
MSVFHNPLLLHRDPHLLIMETHGEAIHVKLRIHVAVRVQGLGGQNEQAINPVLLACSTVLRVR